MRLNGRIYICRWLFPRFCTHPLCEIRSTGIDEAKSCMTVSAHRPSFYYGPLQTVLSDAYTSLDILVDLDYPIPLILPRVSVILKCVIVLSEGRPTAIARRVRSSSDIEYYRDYILHSRFGFYCNSQSPLSVPNKNMSAPIPLFTPVECGGQLSLPQLFDFQRIHSPNFPLFLYKNADTGNHVQLTYKHVGERIHFAARQVLEHVEHLPTRLSSKPHVIAIIAVAGEPKSISIEIRYRADNKISDTITATTIVLGILRAGCIPFLVAPRNSKEAIQHLLKKSEAELLYYSNDEATRLKAESSGMEKSRLQFVPTFEELYSPDTVFDLLPEMGAVDMSSTCVIFHSSGESLHPLYCSCRSAKRVLLPGSTAFPKVIPISHRNVEAYYTLGFGTSGYRTQKQWSMIFCNG